MMKVDQLTNEQMHMIFWLAARDVIMFGTYSEEEQAWTTGYSVCINVNDTFAYASADAEEIAEADDIAVVDALYSKFGWAGPVAYCAVKRKHHPLKAIRGDQYWEALDYLREMGYDISEMRDIHIVGTLKDFLRDASSENG